MSELNTITITIKASQNGIDSEVSDKPIGMTDAQYDALLVKALGVVGGRVCDNLSNGDYDYAKMIAESLYNWAKHSLESIHNLR